MVGVERLVGPHGMNGCWWKKCFGCELRLAFPSCFEFLFISLSSVCGYGCGSESHLSRVCGCGRLILWFPDSGLSPSAPSLSNITGLECVLIIERSFLGYGGIADFVLDSNGLNSRLSSPSSCSVYYSSIPILVDGCSPSGFLLL